MSLIRSIGTIRQLQHNDQWLRLHCPFMCRQWLMYTTVCATWEIRASSNLWSRCFERQRQYVATYTDSCLNNKKRYVSDLQCTLQPLMVNIIDRTLLACHKTDDQQRIRSVESGCSLAWSNGMRYVGEVRFATIRCPSMRKSMNEWMKWMRIVWNRCFP